jgi:serine/threonine-protein phosphatase Stp1
MSHAGPLDCNILSAGRFRCSAATHTSAARTRNEDRFVNRPDLGIWAVADGAGGHQAGDVAAQLVTDVLDAVPSGLVATELLAEVRQRVAQAHESLRSEAARRGGETILATTIVALLVQDDHYACLWAGDSRAYLLRDGQLAQLSHDHSLVQELVDTGVITADEAYHHPRSNIITRAVGAAQGAVEIDKVSGPLQTGDRFLLCSDGLSKTLPRSDITRLLATEGSPAASLIGAALEAGADDNVTAVTIEVFA